MSDRSWIPGPDLIVLDLVVLGLLGMLVVLILVALRRQMRTLRAMETLLLILEQETRRHDTD